MSTETTEVTPEVTEEVVPHLEMVFVDDRADAKAFATAHGWKTYCVIPRTSDGEGMWLVRGVKTAKAMPKTYKATRYFKNMFLQRRRVTCGFGKEAHVVEMTIAEAIHFHNRCPEHR